MAAAVLALAPLARADPPAAPSGPPPTATQPNRETITGRESEAAEPGHLALGALDTLLFLPRELVELTVDVGSGATTLVENEQVVPRVKGLLFSPDGQIGVFPTAFVETGFSPNVGARMVASVGSFASTLRVGYANLDTNLVEGRLLYALPWSRPVLFSIEGLYQRSTDLGYAGVGPSPTIDARNAFNPLNPATGAEYLQSRRRMILGVGGRPASDFEVLMSTSVQARKVIDAPDAVGVNSIADVFLPGTVPGYPGTSWRNYSEATVRLDTREYRGPPLPGTLVEFYAGYSQGVNGTRDRYVASGGRLAWFAPVYRRTNILSPKIAIDTISQVGNVPVGFFEYRAPPDYRGNDGRVDNVAATISLDYRWLIMRYVAARLFTDLENVARNVDLLRLTHAHETFGFGLDLHSSTTQLGQLAVAAGPDGFRFLFTYGAPAVYGDRQHR